MIVSRTPAVNAFLNGKILKHFINGEWVESEATSTVIDPSDGNSLADVSMGTEEDTKHAVQSADSAFPAWSGLSASERAVYLHRLADLIEKHAEDLAQLEALDVGKALVNARGFDIPFGVECLRYFATLAPQVPCDVPLALPHIEARTHRAPYGVCGFIFPWNFPYNLLLWGIVPALAAGNTVVIKPAELTPLSTLYVCKLAEEAGFPKGVINVVVGKGRVVGTAMMEHPLVRRISFTGSTSVGRAVGEVCGRRLIPCKLELGGKGAAVVYDDVDPKAVAQALAGAITLNTGQVCCTATRWFVHKRVYDEFVNHAVETLKSTKIGRSLDDSTGMEPVVSAMQKSSIEEYLNKGIEQGAKPVLLESAYVPEDLSQGYYLAPSLLEGDTSNICYSEELFGPSAYLVPFDDASDVIGTVNRLEYGLANSIWTADIKRANRVAEQLLCGNSWINAHNVFAYGLPYGGYRMSGLGGDVNSPETYYDYLHSQSIARPLA